MSSIWGFLCEESGARMVYIDKYDFSAIFDHLLFTEKRTYINKEYKLLTGFSAVPYLLPDNVS
jgi:hypothetical protein